jgi:hypothetical protein
VDVSVKLVVRSLAMQAVKSRQSGPAPGAAASAAHRAGNGPAARTNKNAAVGCPYRGVQSLAIGGEVPPMAACPGRGG